MQSIAAQVLQLALHIQQIPAPTFHEAERAAWVKARLSAEGLPTEQDEVGNVYACLSGRGEAPPVVVTAHLDTVFPAETDLRIRRRGHRLYGPGLGDNSLGVAGLFGLLWAFHDTRPPGDLWLVANVGEEGLGDLRGMRAVVARFGARPAAYIVLEGMALGTVYHRALGVRRYRITVRTAGGHSWVHYGTPSAVHEAAQLTAALAALPLPARPRTTLNVGRLQGGISVNTIAPEAWLEVDLRSEAPTALENLAQQVLQRARAQARPGVEIHIQPIGDRPAGTLPPTHPLVQAAVQALAQQGIPARLEIGSTDANIPLSQGLPAVTVGLTEGGKAHTTEEYILVEPLTKGLAALYDLVQRAFRLARE